MARHSCANCGNLVPIQNKFCGSCGSGILINLESVANESELESMVSSEPFEKVKSNRNENIIVTLAIGSLFLMLVGFVSLSNESSTDTSAKQSQESTTEAEFSILDEYAYQFVNRGEALVTLQNLWGVALSDSGGYITLRELADNSFNYLQASVGGNLTKENIRVSFQPGNTLNSFFSRLLNNPDAYFAVLERMQDLAV